MKSGDCKRNVDIRDELLACSLDAATCIKKGEDQVRRTERDLRTRVAKCTESNSEIFGYL